jgi:hypothetical protein
MSIDAQVCVFCHGPNECMAFGENPCWCMDQGIPTELTELVPDHLKRQSCICISCIKTFKENKQAFINRYGAQLNEPII